MIIDRYMVREVLVPFAVVVLVLLAIFLTYSLTRFLTDANAGLLKVVDVANLTLLKALISLEVLVPLALYLGVMIGMGRLYSDSEIYAMRASGISERRLLRPVIAVAVVVALLIGMHSVWVRPWAYQSSYEIRALAESNSDIDRIRAGRFYSFEENGRTIFIETIQPGSAELEKVFIRIQDGTDLQVITAERGTMEYDVGPRRHRLRLHNAHIFKSVTNGPNLSARITRMALWVPIRDPKPVGYKAKAKATPILSDSSQQLDRGELQWRLSTPISTLLLALLAIPLSRSRPRQGRYAKMLLAVVIYAVYYNFLDVGRTWVELGTAATIWWVPGLLAALVVLLYAPWYRMKYRLNRNRHPDNSDEHH